MKYPFLLPLLCIAVHSGYANLGDNLQQVEARYGESDFSGNPGLSPNSKLPPSWVTHYTHGDYKITVRFFSFTSGCEEFVRKDGKDFTGREIQKLLDADRLDSSWEEVPLPNTDENPLREWVLINKKALATYDTRNKTLTVKRKIYLEMTKETSDK